MLFHIHGYKNVLMASHKAHQNVGDSSSSAWHTGSRVKCPSPSLLQALSNTEISTTNSPDLHWPPEFLEGELQAKLYVPTPPFWPFCLGFLNQKSARGCFAGEMSRSTSCTNNRTDGMTDIHHPCASEDMTSATRRYQRYVPRSSYFNPLSHA